MLLVTPLSTIFLYLRPLFAIFHYLRSIWHILLPVLSVCQKVTIHKRLLFWHGFIKKNVMSIHSDSLILQHLSCQELKSKMIAHLLPSLSFRRPQFSRIIFQIIHSQSKCALASPSSVENLYFPCWCDEMRGKFNFRRGGVASNKIFHWIELENV